MALQLRARNCVAVQQQSRGRRTTVVTRAYQFDVSVRPYTLRKGDTLKSIAQKRGLTVDQVININPDVKPDVVTAGQTILLPAGTLSSRDREILGGIGAVYRIYPVRKGETLSDVISKRNISRAEMSDLNPGVNLDKLKEGQLLKLPANKFTVREREMLIGSGILPVEFFAATKNPFVIGAGALMLVCGFVMAWQRFYDEDKAIEAEMKDLQL
ncbi:chitinase-related protein [Scenedesmus sp. NREL 46B-D3]|nr:chitinase-related protein [Scenedesmus sp. NREL 46B-D3]